ncbi:hypothetical protein [Mesoterricola silvestris]|uniref:Uncharacterized protein n=1 Tax=Mesoterricola silvestris TaxID=2927979 RepID=A0AA48GT24_9BACT|nr:hypothetical protein [Mesoterricola silvestris]BDU73785.1 hypothetical protein METEAL_29590 [Mesoterricola silvestris]
MLALALAASLFLAPPEETPNPIAPVPAAALRSTSAIKGKLTTSEDFKMGGKTITRGQNIYGVKLRPGQSLMAEIRGQRPSLFLITLTDKVQRPIDRQVTRVGGKVILFNRKKENLDFVVVVSGTDSMTDEPYELVLYELDTERALAKD